MFSTIPSDNWKNTLDSIYKLGTEQKVEKAETIAFLSELDLIEQGISEPSLNQAGKDLFRLHWVLKEEQKAGELFKKALLKHPAVSLMVQVFNGRGPVSREQVRTLLIHHKLIPNNLSVDELGPLLAALNNFDILKYDKKNSRVTINHESTDSSSPPQYFVSPTTPFSNVNNLRKIIRASKGGLYWIDKHFRKEGFEPLIDAADGETTTKITIISGNENLTASAKNDYIRAQQELSQRGICLEWHICTDSTYLASWHDRWIVAANHTYNIPPVLSIIRGQQSEMLKTSNKPDVQQFLNNCTPVL